MRQTARWLRSHVWKAKSTNEPAAVAGVAGVARAGEVATVAWVAAVGLVGVDTQARGTAADTTAGQLQACTIAIIKPCTTSRS